MYVSLSYIYAPTMGVQVKLTLLHIDCINSMHLASSVWQSSSIYKVDMDQMGVCGLRHRESRCLHGQLAGLAMILGRNYRL